MSSALVGLGLTAAGAIRGRGRPSSIDIEGIINKYRGIPTTGTLNPEDYTFANNLYQTGAEKVGQRRTGRRAMAAASLAAKGLSLSPVSERLQQEDDSTDASSLTELERSRQGALYGIRQGRERYNQQFNLQSMLASLAGAKYNAARKDAATAGFMNSLLEGAPGVFDFFSSLASGTPQTDIMVPGGGVGNLPLPDQAFPEP